MKNIILSLSLILLVTSAGYAQYNTKRNNVWAFGTKGGLDFNSGSPVGITTAITSTYIINEGCASVSDTSGHLLFYTDGRKVYNRNHVLMPSGDTIVPFETYSTTQAAVIVPVIGSMNRYYIFSLEQVNYTVPGSAHLAYSIVDMSLDGGLGDVVTTEKNIALADSLSEKMVAVKGTDQNIWLVAHAKDTALFLAFELTVAGVNPVPVISASGTFRGENSYCCGTMKASHNSSKLVAQCQNFYAAISKGTELYDFNPATGIVSNCMKIDDGNLQYGAEFSPDNTKLYTEYAVLSPTARTIKIFQYDISSGSSAAIVSSKTLVVDADATEGSDIKLGPDNKIYFAGKDDSTWALGLYSSRYLDCISNPNLPGLACNYLPHVVKLADTTGIYFGLPATVISVDNYVAGVALATSVEACMTIYPNPARSSFTISAPSSISSVSIHNVWGQPVFTRRYRSASCTIDISTLPAGIYFVKADDYPEQKLMKQ